MCIAPHYQTSWGCHPLPYKCSYGTFSFLFQKRKFITTSILISKVKETTSHFNPYLVRKKAMCILDISRITP